MKIVLYKFFAVVFAMFYSLSFAQKIDDKAKIILDAVSGNYKQKDNTYFKFTYTTPNKVQNGTFYTSGDKYKLKVTDTEQIFDGNKVYNINRKDKEVTIAKPTSKKVIISPLNYIDSYNEGYNVEYVGEKNIGKIQVDHIKMIPVDGGEGKYVNIYINSAKKQLVKLEQILDNNEVETIEVSKYSENQKISESTFTFDKSDYKNYVITEL